MLISCNPVSSSCWPNAKFLPNLRPSRNVNNENRGSRDRWPRLFDSTLYQRRDEPRCGTSVSSGKSSKNRIIPCDASLAALSHRSGSFLTLIQAKPALSARGFQIAVVDYNDADNLKYALRGIDTVISTVTGPNQIHLIKAAVSARVRRFAPAEFEGPPQLRPPNDPLDRQRSTALSWLRHYRNNIEYTVFVCGIFYERFQPGGLPQALIARNTGIHGEGTYIFDCARMTAESPALNPSNQPDVTICMTSVRGKNERYNQNPAPKIPC